MTRLEEAERTRDGRNVDPRIGALEGEAAGMVVRRPGEAWPGVTAGPLPVLKRPVWKAWIPLYFYAGGVTGACGVLGAAAAWSGRPELRRLGRRVSRIGAAMNAIGTACLVADLGRPERFLHMMRVFRPTSPMNVGTWVLAGSSALHVAGALLPPRLARGPQIAAGAFDLPMAGYTAVLLGATAVPVWHHARRTLPALFVASSMAAAASLLQLLHLSQPEVRVVRRFGLAGKAAEAVAMEAVERECRSAHPRVARPLRHGRSGLLWGAAKALSIGSLALSLWPDRPSLRHAAGLAGTLGALALRFAVASAGAASARDPEATFAPQRRRLGDGSGRAAPPRGRILPA